MCHSKAIVGGTCIAKVAEFDVPVQSMFPTNFNVAKSGLPLRFFGNDSEDGQGNGLNLNNIEIASLN